MTTQADFCRPKLPVPSRLLAALLALAACVVTVRAHGNAESASPEIESEAPVHFDAYVVRAMPAEEIDDLYLPEPELPDLSPYTREAVMAKIERKPGATAQLRRVVEMIQFKEFTGGDGRLTEWARRQSSHPRAIVIENGYMTPRDLAAAVDARYFEETEPGVFVLRLPLMIGHGATLHIDDETKDFRMSEERGAFLINDGMLFITGSKLTAWRESANGPALFVDAKKFRPFLLSWGGTGTYIVDSIVASLGYSAGKSYGVSISQYTPATKKFVKRERPTGWIIDSEFVDHLYGFYCYEADDVVIARNVYRDNIVYGIDPHDRSERLIIAENEAYGTKKSHGIIISREVNNSWIFRNRSYDNKLSGIVIDRSSEHNVIADNTTFDNGSDGITIYESNHNLLWGNHAIGNGRHGIRVRNSQDVRLYHNRSIANKSSGVYGHIKDLTGTDRDLDLDPFSPEVSMIVVGGQLVHNMSGPISIDQPLSLELYDISMLAPNREAGLRMSGVLGDYQHQVLDILVRRRLPVIIEPTEGAGRGGAGEKDD